MTHLIRWVLTLFLTLFAFNLRAEPVAPEKQADPAIMRLQGFLDTTKGFQADFVQSVQGGDWGSNEIRNGRFSAVKPGQIGRAHV